MLVAITLLPEDVLQITREAGGKTVLTIPSDILIRSYADYLALVKPIERMEGETVQ